MNLARARYGDVEVDELGVVVVTGPEGDGKADLPQGAGRTVADPGERLGGAEPCMGHVELAKCLHGKHI